MLTKKQLSIKLQKEEETTKSLRAELGLERQKNRRARAALKRLEASRNSWKSKYAKLRKSAPVSLNGLEVSSPSFRIERHVYSSFIVSLSLRLYMLCGCSLRGVVSVLKMLYGPERAPCKSSVSNWLRKSGYYVYKQGQAQEYEQGYSLILDESMVIGQERILLTLILKAEKDHSKPLMLKDVSVAHLEVKPSWKAQDVQAFLEQVERQEGKPPEYVISDGDTTLKKAIKDLNWLRIDDVGHHIACLLRHTYKQASDFEAFSKAINQVKFQAIMKPSAYLLPPKSRTDARFMNLSHQVKWAVKILKVWPNLTPTEQQLFAFIPTYQPLIEEMQLIFELINPLLAIIKSEGLARKSVKKIYPLIREAYHKAQRERTRKLITKIREYLWEHLQKLPRLHSVYHASSDIIESVFGLFKYRKSHNPLDGVTPSVLIIPLATKIDPQKRKLNFCVKRALEETTTKQIDLWAKKYLIPNQVARRKKVLNL